MAETITSTTLEAGANRHHWSASFEDYLAAKAAADAAEENLRGRSGTDLEEHEFDRLSAIAGDAENALIRMPAPDLAALKWKLDKLLSDDGDGYISPWSADYLSQTRADIARLMTT